MSQPRRRSWIARLLFPAQVEAGPFASADAGQTTDQRASMLVNGGGSASDYVRAVECLRKAAENGDAPAQTNLGTMFAFGRGVVRSEVEASRWFRRAAEQGDAGGQFYLGNLCHPASLVRLVAETGEARIQAYMWFTLAAAQGYDAAEASCETLNMQMSSAEVDEGNRRAAAFLPIQEAVIRKS